MVLDLVVDDYHGRPYPDGPAGHLRAQQARWLAREYLIHRRHGRLDQKLMEEGPRLFADHPRMCERIDLMWGLDEALHPPPQAPKRNRKRSQDATAPKKRATKGALRGSDALKPQRTDVNVSA